MEHHDWVSVSECDNGMSASIVSDRLDAEDIPNRVVSAGFRGGPAHWIWVPPEFEARAKKLLSEDAVPEDELTREALGSPPPDDV